MEHPPPLRGLLRDLRYRCGVSYDQPAPLHRPARLSRQPRPGQGAAARPDLCAVGREDGRLLAGRRTLCRDDRSRADAGDEPPQCALLRGHRRRRDARARVAGIRRKHRCRTLLHLGHDRQSQGRPLHPSLDIAPCLRAMRVEQCRPRDHDVVCPIVPMFHVNAWGVPYAAAMAGAKLVFPGSRLDAASLQELFDVEGVTCALGVPTVWLGLLQHLEATGKRIDSVKPITCGGAAVPISMIRTFAERHGVTLIHGWGMTEMSPVGSLSIPKPRQLAEGPEAEYAIRARQGTPLYGIEFKIVGPDRQRLPEDGIASGELLVRGPWVIGAYYQDEAASRAALDAEGWFRTGDVATIDAEGCMQIVDRSKDVIKSGGEWISSIDLENAAMGHPDVAEAAVIGLPHPKWDERPLLVVVAKPG